MCEKAVTYLWPEEVLAGSESTNLASGCDIIIMGHYGSSFDLMEYSAIICDDCLEQAIQRRRVNFTKERSMF